MPPVPARPPEPSVARLRDVQGDAVPDKDEPFALYWRFYWAVAEAQLARWLPRVPARVLDLAGDTARSAAQAAAAGHRVIQVLDPHLDPQPASHDLAGATRLDGARPGKAATAGGASVPVTGGSADRGDGAGSGRAGGSADVRRRGTGSARGAIGRYRLARPAGRGAGPPTVPRRVVADSGSLGFLADACVDAVVAENRVLSRHLVTEVAVAEIARVLRPGGRVLLSVDSLTLGMAVLAERNCWAHLSDVPSAEVLLVPWPDGTMTRCFWAEQLRELLSDAGLEVEWIKPRTVLSPSTVEHVLASSPRALPRLVRTELNAPLNDDSLGVHLLASARRPG